MVFSFLNSLISMKMPYKAIHNSDKIDVEKCTFYSSKEPIYINYVIIESILLLDKNSIGTKSYEYFVGYKNFHDERGHFLVKLRKLNAI